MCRAVAEAETETWSPTTVDQLVDHLFFQPTAQKEDNLQYVRSNIRENSDQRQLVQLYKKVYYQNDVREDERSLLQNRLRLIGLVRIEDHTLQVRNRIYRNVFDDIWIKENLPPNWTQRITYGAVTVLVITIIFLGYFIPSQKQQEHDTTIQLITERFQQGSGDPDVRLDKLARLCEIEAQPQAQALFLQLGQPDRVAMFQKVNAAGANEQLGRAVECLYPAVNTITDVDQRAELTTAMCCALQRWNQHKGERFGQRLGFSCDCDDGVDDDDE